MKPSRVLRLAGRELRAGPRSPIFLIVVFMPLLITFLLGTVVLSILDPHPRIALSDLGNSDIPAAAAGIQGMEVTMASDREELLALVVDGAVDAGLVLPDGFDAEVREGERPPLEIYFSESSPASTRAVVVLSMMGLVRSIQGADQPVTVEVISPEGDDLPLSDRLLPSIVMFVLMIAGIFAPAFMLVEERERGTLQAVLVTPATISEVLLSKAFLGFFMAMAVSYLTLFLNGVTALHPLALLATMASATIMCVAVGLIYGCLADNAKTLFTLVKTVNILLAAPVVFYIFPSWPDWVARLFPTYWFIEPLYRVTLHGEGLDQVSWKLGVSLGISIVLVLLTIPLGRRLQRRTAGN